MLIELVTVNLLLKGLNRKEINVKKYLKNFILKKKLQEKTQKATKQKKFS